MVSLGSVNAPRSVKADMLFCLWEIHHFWGIYRSVLGLSLEHTKIRKAVGLSQDLVVVDNLCDHMIGNVYVAWPLGGPLLRDGHEVFAASVSWCLRNLDPK